MMTEPGLRQLFRLAAVLSPIDMRVNSVSGRLVGPFRLTGLDVDTGSLRVSVRQVDVGWHPRALVSGNLIVDRIGIEGIKIVQLVESTEPFELPDRLALPLDVVIDELEMTEFSWQDGQEGKPFQIQRVGLAADLGKDKFTLEGIDLLAGNILLSGEFNLEPVAAYAVDSELQWKIDLPDMPSVEAVTVVSGNLDQLDVRLVLDVEEILPSIPAITVTGDLLINIPGGDVSYSADIALAVDSAISYEVNPEVNLSGSYADKVINIDDLQVVLPGENSRLMAAGQIDLSGEDIAAAISASWTNIGWPVDSDAQFSSPEGRFEVAGNPADYRVETDFVLQVSDWLNSPVVARGNGDSGSLTLDRLAFSAILGGTADSNLSISWSDGIRAELKFPAAGLNPQTLLAEASGDLQFDGDVFIDAQGGSGFTIEFAVNGDGTLLERDIQFIGNGMSAGEDLVVNRLDLESGDSRLWASGTVGTNLGFEWDIASPHLGDLLPGATGTLNSAGTVSGSLLAPVIEASLDMADFSWRSYKIGKATVMGDVDPWGDRESSIVVQILDAATGDSNVASATLSVDGTSAEHVVNIEISSDVVYIEGRIGGSLEGLDTSVPGWVFEIRKLSLLPTGDLVGGRPWGLDEAAAGRLSGSDWKMEELCLSNSEGSGQAIDGDAGMLCASGEVSGDTVDLHTVMQRMPISYITEYFYPDLTVFGTLGGSASLTGMDFSDVSIDIAIEASETDFRAHDRNGNDFRILKLEPTRLDITSNEQGLRGTIDLDAPDVGTLSMDFGIDPGSRPLVERGLSGEFGLQVPDISPFIAFLPQLETLGGDISGFAILSGSLAEPSVSGRVELSQGNVVMSELGLDLSDIYLLAETQDGLLYDIDGGARSCAGEITADGSLNLDDSEPVSVLNIIGENFEFCNSATFQMTVSPTIQIRTRGRNIEILGDVSVSRADIRPASGASTSAITASRDQVVVDPNVAPQTLPLLINSEVNVRLGNAVRFSGFGLDTRLTGNLGISDPPGKPTLARGELQLVDGTFQAYGQRLEIEEGRLVYAGGPLTEPGIVLRAVRRPNRSVLVGLNVNGSLARPRLELFSEPDMSHAERLSWLTTGRALSELTGGESSSLSQAALALSLSGGNQVTTRIGNRLGLDQFGFSGSGGGFEGDSGGQSALTLGKYISPRLFISYAIGVFEPVNIFRAEFSINNNWKVVTETDGVNNRGDIFFEIEKGSVDGDIAVRDE